MGWSEWASAYRFLLQVQKYASRYVLVLCALDILYTINIFILRNCRDHRKRNRRAIGGSGINRYSWCSNFCVQWRWKKETFCCLSYYRKSKVLFKYKSPAAFLPFSSCNFLFFFFILSLRSFSLHFNSLILKVNLSYLTLPEPFKYFHAFFNVATIEFF